LPFAKQTDAAGCRIQDTDKPMTDDR
jgi:hypothetical protein